MHHTLENVDRVEELLQRLTDDLPYEYKSLFPVDGFWAKRASQKRLALLKRIDEALRPMLWPGERVMFLTSGVLVSFWESYFLGLPMYYLNRRALVLTNERLILVQIDSRRRPRELRSQVLLRAIAKVGSTLLGNTTLKLQAGKRYTIAYMQRRDRRSLSSLIESGRGQATKDGAATAIEHLCPHCYAVVADHPDACPSCRGAFKSSKVAGLRSLLFPGLGDIYIGHWRFAIVEILVASVVWLSVLLPDGEGAATAGDRLAAAPVVFLLLHVTDAIATRYVARKGHYPAVGGS